MDSKDIIKYIDEFFLTADEKALAEVERALAIQIDGDISIEEYLSGFGNEYAYTAEPVSIPQSSSLNTVKYPHNSKHKSTSHPGRQSSF